jgi:hypothetical protein
MNFRDRNYMTTSSSTESLKGAAFLSKMLGILRGKRVPTPHAELVAVVIGDYTQNPVNECNDSITMSAPTPE